MITKDNLSARFQFNRAPAKPNQENDSKAIGANAVKSDDCAESVCSSDCSAGFANGLGCH